MKIRALGTKFNIGKGPTPAPVPVGNLSSIGGLELSADTIDVTTLDSTGGYREFIAGFKDAGEVALEGILMLQPEKDRKNYMICLKVELLQISK